MAEMKICPYCGEEIMATAKKCRHCGEWLEEEPIREEETSAEDGEEENKAGEAEGCLGCLGSTFGCLGRYVIAVIGASLLGLLVKFLFF